MLAVCQRDVMTTSHSTAFVVADRRRLAERHLLRGLRAARLPRRLRARAASARARRRPRLHRLR